MNNSLAITVSSSELLKTLNVLDYNRKFDTPVLYDGTKKDWDLDYYAFVEFFTKILENSPELIFERASNKKNGLLILLSSGFLTDTKAMAYCSDFLNSAYAINPNFDFLSHLKLNKFVFENGHISSESLISVLEEMPLGWLRSSDNTSLLFDLEHLSSNIKHFNSNIWGFDTRKNSSLFLKFYKIIKNRIQDLKMDLSGHLSTSFNFDWFDELHNNINFENQHFMDGTSVKNHFFMLALKSQKDSTYYLSKLSSVDRDLFSIFQRIEEKSKENNVSSNKYVNGDVFFEEIENNPHYLEYKTPDGLPLLEFLAYKFPTTFRSYLYALDSKKKLTDVQKNIIRISSEKSSYSGFSVVNILLFCLKNNRTTSNSHYHLESMPNFDNSSVIDLLSSKYKSLYWQSSFVDFKFNNVDIDVEKNIFFQLNENERFVVLEKLFYLSFNKNWFVNKFLKQVSPELSKIIDNLNAFDYEKTNPERLLNINFNEILVSSDFKKKLKYYDSEFNVKLNKNIISEVSDISVDLKTTIFNFSKYLVRPPLGISFLYSRFSRPFFSKALELMESQPEVLKENVRNIPLYLFFQSIIDGDYLKENESKMYNILNKTSAVNVVSALLSNQDEDKFLETFSSVFKNLDSHKWFSEDALPLSSLFLIAKKIQSFTKKKDFLLSAFENSSLSFSPPYQFSTYDLLDAVIPKMIEKNFDLNVLLEDGKSLKDYIISSKNTELIALISKDVTPLNNFKFLSSFNEIISQKNKIDMTRYLIRNKINENSNNYLEKDVVGANVLFYLAYICPTALISEWNFAKKSTDTMSLFKEAVESKDTLGRGIGYYFQKANHKESIEEQLYSHLPDFVDLQEVYFLKKEILGWRFDRDNKILFKNLSPPHVPATWLNNFGFSEEDKELLRSIMLDDILGNTDEKIKIKTSDLSCYDPLISSTVFLYAIENIAKFTKNNSRMKEDVFNKKMEESAKFIVKFLESSVSSLNTNDYKDKFLFEKIEGYIEFVSSSSVRKTESFKKLFDVILPKLITENKIKKSVEASAVLKKSPSPRF